MISTRSSVTIILTTMETDTLALKMNQGVEMWCFNNTTETQAVSQSQGSEVTAHTAMNSADT